MCTNCGQDTGDNNDDNCSGDVGDSDSADTDDVDWDMTAEDMLLETLEGDLNS